MDEKRVTSTKTVEQLHFRVNQIEVLAIGRFAIVIVVAAVLLAVLLV